MRILLVEDEPGISSFVSKAVKAEGYSIDVSATAQQGLFWAKTNDYDLAILDIMLPDGNGLDICKEIRKIKPQLPVLILTVRESTTDKVTAFDAGADDYLTKPFAVEELLARVRALLRRQDIYVGDILTVGDIKLDVRRQKAYRRGKLVELRTKELALLEYLMRNQGAALSRTMLLEHVWDMNIDPFTNTVDVHIRALRRKLGDPNGHIIKTIYGRGYTIGE